MNAARVQEEVEREWRQKEKEEALRKAETQKSLMEDREKQINYKRIMQAIELERERREFEKIVRVQKEAFCREKKELEEKQRQALIHRSEILKQVFLFRNKICLYWLLLIIFKQITLFVCYRFC